MSRFGVRQSFLSGKLRTQKRRQFTNKRRVTLSVEPLERRELLTANGFVQGTAFLDTNSNLQLDSLDTRLPNAQVQLFQNSSLVQSTTTAADGTYTFTGVAPGTYQVVETPPAGFNNALALPNAPLWGASVLTASTIQVTVPDSSQLQAAVDVVSYYNNGVPNHWQGLQLFIGNTLKNDLVGQLPLVVSDVAGGPVSLNTFCVDLQSGASFALANNIFNVNPQPTLTDQVSFGAHDFGRVAYLYNHFGSQPLSSINAAALQVAIWEAEYDTGDDVLAGVLRLAGPSLGTTASDFSAIVAQAQFYLANAAGKSEQAIYLDATPPAVQGGYQGVIAPGSLNFGNVQIQTAQLRGKKFTDRTGDGISNDDTPLSGVVINLYEDLNGDGHLDVNEDDVAIQTDVTDIDGAYSFAGLQPGKYIVQEVVPSGYQPTSPTTLAVTLAAGADITTGFDFANFKQITINGTKYTDITGDSFSADDTPLANVTINLYAGASAGGSPIATTTTAADGSYSFSDLGPGMYFVQEVVASGYVQTGGTAGYTINATSGSDSTGNNFDNFQKGSITGTKFTDITGDSFSGDDTPLGGVTINLYAGSSASGSPIETKMTAADGSYTFDNLAPGTYFVQEALPAGYVQTGGSAGYVVTIGGSGVVSGGTSSGNNFDNFKKITISGTKYTDITGNSFSADDTPLANVTINLYSGTSASGSPIATTTTAADGSYSFGDLGPGTYFVQEVLAGGYVQTGGTAGYTINATSGTDSTGNNFDNFKKITISGTKYTDITGNSFSADDTPLGGVTINLYKDGGTSPVATTTTAADGSYNFGDLGPGTYFVQEVVPGGYVQTGGTAGYTINATSGTDATGNNFDNFKQGKITGTKFTDITGNGFSGDDTPLGGVTINLYAGNSMSTPLYASTSTAADGTYSFHEVPLGTYFVQESLPAGYVQTGGNAGYVVMIGGSGGIVSGGTSSGNNFDNFKKITISGTKYTDITGNSFSADDTPLGGVMINLYKDGGTSPVATTTTGADGSYSFGDLGPGVYLVQEVLPSGYVQTGGTAGYTINATSGTHSTGNNFDNFQKGRISGTKFKDLTGNSFSADDTPLGNVTINLYAGTSASGSPLATTTTAADGSYSFANLGPGNYFVQEVVPANYVQTGGNAGYTIVATSGFNSTGNNFDNQLLTPGIDIEKTTAGSTNSNTTTPDYDNEDSVNGPGVPLLTAGSTVTWTYKVTNTGNVAFALADVKVVDDNGTPSDTSDDLSTTASGSKKISATLGNGSTSANNTHNIGDLDNDNFLDPSEIWYYTAGGTVLNLAAASSTTATFGFSGNSSLNGSAGNIRTFTAGAVSVNASAFSRSKSSPFTWNTAYLGSYSGGLGVTDTSEDGNSNTHTVDNGGGRDNYILLEFSDSIIVDSAFLGYVVGDSDMSVWIGTKTDPFNNHQTLSDSFLSSLGFTEISSGGSTTRSADLNAGGVIGNVVVIAAKCGDSDDMFKLQSVTVNQTTTGSYENKAVVTVNGYSGLTDSDLSHYKNSTPTGSISGKKWQDQTGNGLSSDDTPLAGTTIYLDANNNGVKDTGERSTVTAADGGYQFTGLGAGTYVVREVVPAGFVRTGPTLSDNFTVTVASNTAVTGKDFANFELCDHSRITCISYTIKRGSTTFTVNDLRGNVNQGDIVTVNFTVAPGASAEQVSLVSYSAPDAYFDANRASLQKIYEAQTGFFLAGPQSLTVKIPNCYFQIDFVCDSVIDKLGPAGSNLFYTPQNRLFSADNDGTTAPPSNLQPLGTTLVVGGGSGNDDIQFKVATDASKIAVRINGQEVGQVSSGSGSGVTINKIAAYGHAGSDSILVTDLAIPALLFGGDGDDILVGGRGDDALQGDDGRDLMIGGLGKDTIRGNAQDDILVGGTTSYDANLAALDKIMVEWTRNDTFTNRVNRLKSTASDGYNTTYNLVCEGTSRTVFDDNVQDILYGDDGSDWLLCNRDADGGSVNDLVYSGELLTDID